MQTSSSPFAVFFICFFQYTSSIISLACLIVLDSCYIIGHHHSHAVEECLCSCCQTIEDDLHFLCICPKYSVHVLREDLESAVLQYCPGYPVLCTDQKFLFLLQSSHPQVNNSVTLYVYKSFKYRHLLPGQLRYLIDTDLMTDKSPWFIVVYIITIS